jgi:hypothetical protein
MDEKWNLLDWAVVGGELRLRQRIRKEKIVQLELSEDQHA